MAATDKFFNDQRKLDIVFGVSNILLLLSVGWMMAQDHYREYKVEQRIFADVESELAIRLALQQIPDKKEFEEAEKAVNDAKEKRKSKKDELDKARDTLATLKPKKEKAEAEFQAVQADVGSIESFLYIAIEHGDTALADRYRGQLKTLKDKLDTAQAKRDGIVMEMKAAQKTVEDIEDPYTKSSAHFKKLNDKLDGQVKLALAKRWQISNWMRALPVIDGFASPLKIHQFVIEDIPIDYNFKRVPRFDRCMTCHVGIDRPAYTRANLESLTKDQADEEKLKLARKRFDDRVAVLDPKDAATIPNPHNFSPKTLPASRLTPARIAEFAAHPRLDLFVGSNSKHPAEKFGCTSCHSGQGSGTSFNDSSHSPNDAKKRAEWAHDRGWEHNHMWDFPMLPTRFVESSCLKCHHEVTDLISSDNRNEAPKLLRGFNLIKENGCFGCHEIHGWKGPNRVGPDLRLEPTPPLEDLLPIERERVKNDPDNRPGNLRKVGPSLARVSEKLSTAWMEKWIRSPSSFRPDTKMPHYFGLSTNEVKVLPDDQKKFPDTEIASIAHFLSKNSEAYLKDAANVRTPDAKMPTAQQDQDRLVALLNMGRLEDKEQKEMDQVKWRIRLRKEAPLKELAKGYKPSKETGRVLFVEKGCLSCHTHQGTEVAQNSDKPELVSPGVHSEALFGPNLSQFAEKVKDAPNARQWLIQWILNPQLHSPRSRMPVTHLSEKQAADVAEWLLGQDAKDSIGADWNTLAVAPPTKDDLKNLARVYLVRMMSKSDMEKYLTNKMEKTELDLIKKDIPLEEYNLAEKRKLDDEGELKMYLGRKAVTRLGCFGCHDIPGFEKTKNIGVGLNDWGKKDASRLAFEDIRNFFKDHYYDSYKDAEGKERPIDGHMDDKGNLFSVKDGKEPNQKLEPYERFYSEALIGHFPSREGYLNQKIRDPRSYDFNRIRAWDDRARMPKFTFARPRPKADEKPDAFKARSLSDEAAAREAVATFILGLVADPVPTKSINVPKGDRELEVKGRQILDKYNCAGCHIIRPGVYDFKLGKSLEGLDLAYRQQQEAMQEGGEITMPNHHNWVGRNPMEPDRVTAFGLRPLFLPADGEINLRLSEALRYKGPGSPVKNIPAGTQLSLSASDFLANPSQVKTQADFDAAFTASAPYGGAFADLMIPYLNKKDAKAYDIVNGDSVAGRAALPPMLIGQGEKTQSAWLRDFLLNPGEVRRMTILRMPKFNMSADEAQALVDYFAGVTRQTNPGIGLSYPFETIASRQDFSSDYWTNRTAAYVAHLKNTKAKDKDGNELKTTVFAARLASYRPLWKRVQQDNQPALENERKKIESLIEQTTATTAAKEKAMQSAKDKDKEALKKEVDELKLSLASFADERDRVSKAIADLDVTAQERAWIDRDAYATDAYRMLMSRDLCTKCHQIGGIKAGEQTKQGPPLDQVADRLRPEWIVGWVAKPQRFVPASLMTQYFKHDKLEHQALYADTSLAQIHALRDVLLNYRRVAAMPVNRNHNPDRPVEK